MAAKLILIMLVTLSHFHSLHSADVWSENGSIVNLLETSFNVNCTDENMKSLYVYTLYAIESACFHANCTDKDGKRLIIFSKDNVLYVDYIDTVNTINLETGMKSAPERPHIVIVNSNMEENVSALCEHFEIQNESLVYMWTNIGSSLDDLLSSGFENVENLSLKNNQLAQLKNQDFQSVKKLKMMDLSYNKVNRIDENTFNTLVKLETLHLLSNELTHLDAVTFQNVSGLRLLDLTHNKLTYLGDGLFDNLRELRTLRLSHNRLTVISGLIFRNLQNVEEIDLSHNNLIQIHRNAFNNINKLATLRLNYNQLKSSDGKLPFLVHLNELMTLTISDNNLTRIPSELINLHSLREVDLSSNQISLFKLSVVRERKNLKFKVNLHGNPLKCDRETDVFLERAGYTQLASECKHILNDSDNIIAHSTLNTNCPVDCQCIIRNTEYHGNFNSHASIICSGRELTTVPEIVGLKNVSYIVMDINNNRLTELPKWPANSTVTFILASHNRISKIEVENLPPLLRGLDVSHNHILSIASNVVDHLSQHPNLELILLIRNPFKCSCWFGDDTKKLIEFAKQHKWMTDLEDAKCDEGYELSIDAHEKNCSAKTITIGLIVSIVIVSVVSGTLVSLFYKHQQFIKVWLYAHKYCLWWVDEEYLDRDLEFDAFVSFAQKDELYVKRLIDELESRTPSYKLFVHDRDFIVGEEIESQIKSTIKRCRRTIIVLTKNFIASPWATHEFHCAHKRSIEEKRNCLIVVKHGDIGDSEQLDEVIRSYIQTYTYIESSDKWFWEKIRYALPHKHVE